MPRPVTHTRADLSVKATITIGLAGLPVPAFAVELGRAGAVIGPGQIGAAPSKAAAERGQQQTVADLELVLVVPQAKRYRCRGGVAVFVDGEHHLVRRQS